MGFQLQAGAFPPRREHYLEQRLDFACDLLMNSSSRFFFHLRPTRLVGRDRAKATDLFLDRGQLSDQILKPMKLADLLGRLPKSSGSGQRLGHALAFHLAEQAELGMPPTARLSAMTGSLSAATGLRRHSSRTEVAELGTAGTMLLVRLQDRPALGARNTSCL